MKMHLPPCADPATLEAIPAGVCLLDARDFRVIAHNRLYQSLLAEPYRTAGVVGLRIEEYLPGIAEVGLLDCHRQLTRTGEPCIVRPCVAREFPYRGFPRGPTYWDIHIAPIRDRQGEVAWQLVTVWEVTERVLAQQRLRAALGRERFLNETVRAFAEASSIDSALRRIADSAVVAVADGCVVHLARDGVLAAAVLRHRDTAREEAWRGALAGLRIPFGEGVAGRVAASEQPELIRDVHPEDTAPRFRPLAARLEAGSILAVPIRGKNTCSACSSCSGTG